MVRRIRKREKKDRKSVTISVLYDEIKHCRSDITSYNLQFMASTVLCALLAAAASIFTDANEKSGISNAFNLFYVLPTLYFFAIYNLIKYTQEQMKLGSYRRVLENILNQYMDVPFLQWETKIPRGKYYVFFGAIVQSLFFVPLAGVLLYGFYMLPHVFWWKVFSLIHILQMGVIIFMAFHLRYVRRETLRAFGYCEDGKGNLKPRKG